jgi:hypothetical protein
MSDGTVSIADNTSKRFVLCRDPCYPLWGDVVVSYCAVGLLAVGSATTWNLPAKANATLALPVFETTYSGGAGPSFDGTFVSLATSIDRGVIVGDAPGTLACYIPTGSTFFLWITTSAAAGGTGIEFEVVSQRGMEEIVSTLTAVVSGNTYLFSGIAGTTTVINGTLGEGIIPAGFSYIRQMRTTATAPVAASTPSLIFGWTNGNTPASLNATAVTVMLPTYTPPEFGNSVIPYTRTRTNASAALFTNVTAALSKEGTVLAGRLKPAVVDPWSFSATNINSIHPSFRYFGPLEKGLYTFTSPSQNSMEFEDCAIELATQASSVSTVYRPKFQYRDIGIYNAIILSDLGSSSTGTQMAVSAYSHLEFEATSSLFTPGVSTLTLESLHAAEIALLNLGHFHENPIHWALLRSLAVKAAQKVLPLVAPYVVGAAKSVANAGVAYVQRKIAGDRSMPQASLAPPRQARRRKVQRKPKRAKRSQRR